jgi:hypothetical protein
MATQFEVDCALMAGNVYQATRAPINWIPALFGWIVILILGISMNAQAQLFRSGGQTMSWKEEVLLHDGQIIIAERFYNLGGYPELSSTERSELNQTVKFNLPGTKRKIVWKTNYNATDIKVDNLILILLDVVNGVPYIATSPAGCFAFEKWKRPDPPYVLFKYEADQWQQIALIDFPIQLTKLNVVQVRPAPELLKPFYNVAEVKKINGSGIHARPHYKRILRLSAVPELCPRELSGPIPPSFRAQ